MSDGSAWSGKFGWRAASADDAHPQLIAVTIKNVRIRLRSLVEQNLCSVLAGDHDIHIVVAVQIRCPNL